MDFLPDLPTLSMWLVQYGSFLLFVLLTLGIIAFPIPEETLMVVAGILMRHQKLPIPGTVLAAFAGSICGISMSYLIGRTVGGYVVTKYGKFVGINEARLKKAHLWFERFGKWTLFVGYFIPGVRHFTGLSAGTTKLHYKQFALFAYSGALVWVSIFLSLGYFFGHCGLALYEKLELTFDELMYGLLILLCLVASAIVIYLYFKKKSR